jgi:competence protein ComEC
LNRASSVVSDRLYATELTEKSIEVSGIMTEDPDISDSETSFRLKNVVINDIQPISGQVFVKVGTDPNRKLSRGDLMKVRGKTSESFGPFIFSFFRPRILEISSPDPPDFSLVLRDHVAEKIKQHIPDPEVSLALGYTLGIRRSLPPELVENLRIVGLTHIIVASGYNLTVLIRFSRKTFNRISRFSALLASTILVIIMIGITGLSPSMSRAGLVAFVSLVTWYFGRSFHPIKLLLFAMALTLLYNPFYLFDLGWALSFASFAGLMIVSPLLLAYFYHDKPPNFLSSTFVETFSAQFICLPVLIYQFGTISLISIIPNLLVLPTIPYVVLGTLLTGVFAHFLPFIADLTGFITTLVLKYHLFIINFFGKLNYFVLQIDPNNLKLTLIITVILIAIIIYLQRTTGLKLHKTNLIE